MIMSIPAIVTRGLNVQESGMTPTVPRVTYADVCAMAYNEATATLSSIDDARRAAIADCREILASMAWHCDVNIKWGTVIHFYCTTPRSGECHIAVDIEPKGGNCACKCHIDAVKY